MSILVRYRRLALPLAAVMVVSVMALVPGSSKNLAAGCPAGSHPKGFGENQMSPYADALDIEPITVCVNDKHPESLSELEAAYRQQFAIQSAPDGIVPAGAYSSAIRQRAAIARGGQARANANRWTPVGKGPLHSMDPEYGLAQLGNGDVAGRINDFFYVNRDDTIIPDTLFAATGSGGIWMTDGLVETWQSIGDSLPTQTTSSVAYTPHGGGTVIALTGDDSFGADSRRGAGVYYTTNLGGIWHRAKGVPDDAFGFKLAVDQAKPNIVYASTGAGLFRSTDGGRSFVNVNLPTGECAGKSNRLRACTLANMVTDVVVQAPGGSTDAAGGKVIAAVGWRGGDRKNPDGSVQSPANGIYTSPDGKPGTFTKSAALGFAPQDRIGRIEFGAAEGPAQNHEYIYAMVQDAVLLRRGTPGIDVPESYGTVPIPTVFHGLFVSSDFGATWKLMTSNVELQHPATGSALAVVQQALGAYGPGVQAWYNMWVRPDPTKHLRGIPTRLLFGLEEIWQNENTNLPQDGHSAFKVVGRYWAGDSCQALVLPPATTYCPFQRDGAAVKFTTPHPDQHDAAFIPTPDGGVRLVAGNDGGAFAQKLASDAPDFLNTNWKYGNNEGFNTLLPYDAARSRDGTIYMGLQDNGVGKIYDVRRGNRVIERERQSMVKGGDGFFVAVHPENGNIAYGEYIGGTIASTIDGGRTWSAMSPPITAGMFSTQFAMDPKDPNHIMIGGNEIVSTTNGPGTGADDWVKLIDLGTHSKIGDATAVPSPTDPVAQMTSVDVSGGYGVAGFCAPCDVLNQAKPFKNGIATNIGGKGAKKGSAAGWHIAPARGLPNRYVTSLAISPRNPKIIYASLGGYFRPWTVVNEFGATNSRAGRGHLYVSVDGGNSFRDISANLPNAPINWVTTRGSQVLVASDLGVFISDPSEKCAAEASATCDRFEVLGNGLPAVPVHTVKFTNGDPNTLIAAAYGRGVYMYRFGPARAATKVKQIPAPKFLDSVVAGPFTFDSGDEGWIPTTNHDVQAWRRTPGGHSPAGSFTIASYYDNASSSLASPAMRLPARSLVELSWWERSDTESGFDYMSVEWSSDGKKWNQVRAFAGQNPSFPEYNKFSRKFVAPAGKLFVRFRLTADGGISSPPYTGVSVDDIQLKR